MAFQNFRFLFRFFFLRNSLNVILNNFLSPITSYEPFVSRHAGERQVKGVEEDADLRLHQDEVNQEAEQEIALEFSDDEAKDDEGK